jgi:uncharacterized protein YndB with AHSA1/START domain
MKIIKVLVVVAIILVLGVAVIYVMGAMLPVEHTALMSATIDAPQQRVWSLITDTAGAAAWRKELTAVEAAPDQGGQPCFREVQKSGKMTFCVVEQTAPSHRVTRIADKGLPFGGTWTYELQPMSETATQLTITEDGEVYPPIWRFLSHYVMGESRTMEVYVQDLQGAVGQKPDSTQ